MKPWLHLIATLLLFRPRPIVSNSIYRHKQTHGQRYTPVRVFVRLFVRLLVCPIPHCVCQGRPSYGANETQMLYRNLRGIKIQQIGLYEICSVDCQEKHQNYCHQTSHFKAKCTKFDSWCLPDCTLSACVLWSLTYGTGLVNLLLTCDPYHLSNPDAWVSMA